MRVRYWLIYLDFQVNSTNRKPNWLLLKETVIELLETGKTVFTRSEIVEYARKKDPSRSSASIDYEIDLVTVNSNSKDRYRDPDKLFLYRIDRGRYQLYNPEMHGAIEEYIYHRTPNIPHELVEQVINAFKEKGYEVKINKSIDKPLTPNLVAKTSSDKIGVWIIDPSLPVAEQFKKLAYAIGSGILDRTCTKHVVIVSQTVYNKILTSTREQLAKLNIELKSLKEEKKYTLRI